MKAVFRAERNAVGNGSGLTGVYDDNNDNIDYRHINSHSYCHNGQLFTPPNEAGHFPVLSRTSSASSSASTLCHPAAATACSDVAAWLEVWDYAGGASFRGFVAEDPSGAKSLFAFFDAGLMGRDLKQALMALIELADSALGCAHVVICVDRRAPAEDAASLMKGLQWAGFSLTTLDLWTGGAGVDVTSPAWVFMGMEL